MPGNRCPAEWNNLMLKKILEFLTLKWLWDRHKDKP